MRGVREWFPVVLLYSGGVRVVGRFPDRATGADRKYIILDSVRVLFSNKGNTGSSTDAVLFKPRGSVSIREVDGSVTNGPARALRIDLLPREVQILSV